ncbi:hypothetical protein BDV93DRAFT_514131 [Ceratobasidium sp. AG-I]|nr:hypothetical protein BDV93DRAFT_514131 [Ceratobasidium sp. AG-I]
MLRAGGNARTRCLGLLSIPRIAAGASAINARATLAHPTLAQTVRKPALALDLFGSCAVHVPALNFQTLAAPYSNLQDVEYPDVGNSGGGDAKKSGPSRDSGSSGLSKESSEELGMSSDDEQLDNQQRSKGM